MTKTRLIDLLLELADIVRDSLKSPTVQLMLPPRASEIVKELERGAKNTG